MLGICQAHSPNTDADSKVISNILPIAFIFDDDANQNGIWAGAYQEGGKA